MPIVYVTFEVSWYAENIAPTVKYFKGEQYIDALMLFTSKVAELNADVSVTGAQVSFKRSADVNLPTGLSLQTWNKTADPYTMFTGADTVEELHPPEPTPEPTPPAE